MGKGRNKNKDKDAYSGPSNPRGHRDDDDSDSGDSISTHLTFDDDMRSVQGDVENVDDILDKLAEHIEHAQDKKNISVKLAALQGIQLALTSHYLPDFSTRYKVTLIDLITKNLHNKTDNEIVVSAVILALLAVQIGGEMSEDVEEPLAAMRTIVMDGSRSDALRSVCALSIAITTRLSCESDDSVAASVKACRHAWSSVKLGAPNSRLFTISLASWCLLLLDADNATLSSAILDQPKVANYLDADQLDNRVAAGEALAFLTELVGENRPGFTFPNHQHVLEILERLVSESTKSKAKRDKRIQRLTFREVYAFMKSSDDAPSVSIKFGKESLVLDTCSIKLFYDLCCEVLRGGMLRQLQQNEALRDVFDLGPVPLETTGRENKALKMAIHEAADKYRNQVRGRQRDKRSTVWS
ncbi:unnamed protein product [Caenorhabditis auriculariae]|uniref:Interferon-related developmental regulator N-terminal domain-containing protein n=1 Tax=Caenorhabditis auriculariae TaxID=2777116 RepID=A0A8S1HAA5_9PELO|nr:unnamed protein product [Caenorhabditis auriculariae]